MCTCSIMSFCDLMDCSPPGSSVHGILQAGIWSALPFSPPGDLSNPKIEPAWVYCIGRKILYHCATGKPISSIHVWSEVKWSEVKSLSHVRLFVTPWTVAYQAPLSLGFFRQEYWNGLPFPSPGDLPAPGIKLAPLASPASLGKPSIRWWM